MSWDFKLTPDHDLSFIDGDLQIVTGSNQTAQHLKIRLYTWLGEWFLDITIGTPYLEKILGQRSSAREQSNVIRRRVLSTNGVRSIINLSFERSGRHLSISGTVRLDNGDTATITNTVG